MGRYREPLAYVIVGGWNTLFGYGCFAALYYLLHTHLHVDVILVFSYVLSIANAYVVQGLFTFVIVALSYFGHKHFSFRGGRAHG